MKVLVYDIETTGTSPWDGEVLCIAATWNDDTGWHDAVWKWQDRPDFLIDMLADPERGKVTHSKFDARFLRLAGYTIQGWQFDTMRMASLLNENQELNLEFLANRYCGIKMDKRLERDKGLWFRFDSGKRVNLSYFLTPEATHAEVQELLDYCHRDITTELTLYQTLRELLRKGLWEGYWLEEEVPYTNVLLNMECSGLPINLPAAAQLKDELEVEVEERKQALQEYLGYDINFGSPDQLRAVLFSDLWKQAGKVPIKKEQRDCLRGRCEKEHTHFTFPGVVEVTSVGTKYAHVEYTRKGLGLKPTPLTKKTKKPSTRMGDITYLHGSHDFVQLLLPYRKVKKVISTYLNTYPKYSQGGRLYGTFNQSGTVTGRLSSSSPNLENQPSRGPLGNKIRSLFQGRLIVGDHSQLEPRLMGHFSGDPVLLDIYRNNKDIYLITASYIFGREIGKDEDERGLCKTLVLGLGYGAGPPTLAQLLSINGYPTPIDRAQEYLAHLTKLYSTFFDWKKQVAYTAKHQGYVKTIGGRFRRLAVTEGDSTWKVMQMRRDRQAVNSIIQGSAADILRRNMLHTTSAFPEFTLLNQVHDELVWEYGAYPTRERINELQVLCENPKYELSIPLVFEPSICQSWADKGAGYVELPDGLDEEE